MRKTTMGLFALGKMANAMPKKKGLFDKPVTKNAVESIIEQDMAANGEQPEEEGMAGQSQGLFKDNNGLEVPQEPKSKLWQKLLQVGLGGLSGALTPGLTPSLLSSIDSPDEKYQHDLKRYQANRLFDQNERKIGADANYKNKLLGLSGDRNKINAYAAGMEDDTAPQVDLEALKEKVRQQAKAGIEPDPEDLKLLGY